MKANAPRYNALYTTSGASHPRHSDFMPGFELPSMTSTALHLLEGEEYLEDYRLHQRVLMVANTYPESLFMP